MRSLALALALSVAACASSPEPGEPPVPTVSAADAFVWGYPLIVSKRTMQTFGRVFGVNKLFNQNTLATTNTKVIVSPNQDTLYSVAVLDLHAEPVVLTVPDAVDRYWTMQLIDAWSGSFHYVGTRATGGKGGTFVIAAPGWTGSLPAGAQRIDAPTPQVLILGRYLVRGADDLPNVNALERKVQTLSQFQGKPAGGDALDLGDPPGSAQEVGAQGGVTFDELNEALAQNPPASAEDKAALARFAPLGLGTAGKPYEAHPSFRATFDKGVTDGLATIVAKANDVSTAKNGWTYRLDIGAGASDPTLRAAVAHVLWGANVAAEAIYAQSTTDGAGKAYEGGKAYVMHFDAGQLPPVDPKLGFWSVTLYGPDRFFVENPLKRHAIGDRTAGLTFGADGSLDLYVQSTAPAGLETNWLPAPTSGPFVLTMRMYLPKEPALSGGYVIPPVVAR